MNHDRNLTHFFTCFLLSKDCHRKKAKKKYANGIHFSLSHSPHGHNDYKSMLIKRDKLYYHETSNEDDVFSLFNKSMVSA